MKACQADVEPRKASITQSRTAVIRMLDQAGIRHSVGSSHMEAQIVGFLEVNVRPRQAAEINRFNGKQSQRFGSHLGARASVVGKSRLETQIAKSPRPEKQLISRAADA